MARYPSARKIKRKKKKGLYYNPSINEFETEDQVSRRLYGSVKDKYPDVIVNGEGMSNDEYMATRGTGAIVDSYKPKGRFKRSKSKVRGK